MKAHEFISRLDDAKYGRRQVSEDSIPAPVAPAPSHAPTSGKDATTKGQGKSEDEGEAVKKAYKQPSGSIPAPVAPAPSHAPTSGKDYTTTGQGKSEDEGEPIKKAMKEAVRQLIDGDGDIDINALIEGDHKAGCQCGFCKNKGSFGKKKQDGDKGADKGGKAPGVGKPKDGDKPEKSMNEAGMMGRLPFKRRLGGDRMNFRQQLRTPPKGCVPPKAAINPHQPAMERLDTAADPDAAIQEMADQLLEAPGVD